MAKYKIKALVDAELFQLGMEDGYACYELDGRFIGHYERDGALPRVNRKPAIKTLEEWYEVEVGKHFIVTGFKGARFPVEVDMFHETYELVDEDRDNFLLNMPVDSSIFGTERLEYLLEYLERANKQHIAAVDLDRKGNPISFE